MKIKIWNKCLDNWKKYLNLSNDIDKKSKLEEVIKRFEQQKFEERKQAELAKLKQEEEKRKKEDFLNSLMKELENDKKDSQSLEEYKIKKKKSDVDFEDIK